ncbi:MAG: hypothetical protein WBA05_13865 [Gordonia sp. (in: high G+C Gram-positive bacteria)]|uniref:hypothetical protein n=1 Tax=Gordonia sp. (in: high G+C Gram-positive bacteria) TaxID=84139 RepID=UPI003C73B918
MWPTDRYGLVHRRTALLLGRTERQLAVAVHCGELVVVARGMYILGSDLARAEHPAVHRYRQRCIAAALGPGRPVLSHDSAAAVHGLDLLYPDRSRVHVTNGRTEGGNTRAQRLTHAGLLPDGDVVEVDGIPVTGIARTVADVALSTARFPQALTAFDAGLRRAADRVDLERRLGTGRRGSALARRALSCADGRSESPGESWSRAQMIEAGLPTPTLQVPYLLASGRRAFCDFGIDDRFVGEFDGLIKYRREMCAGPGIADRATRDVQRHPRCSGPSRMTPNVSIAVARAIAERRRPPHR